MISNKLKEDLELILCGDRTSGKKIRVAQAVAQQHFKLDNQVTIDDSKEKDKDEDKKNDDRYDEGRVNAATETPPSTVPFR